MERIGNLIQKLQEQYARQAPWEQILLTVRLLQTEIMQQAAQPQNGISVRPAAPVIAPTPIPSEYQKYMPPAAAVAAEVQPEEKSMPVLSTVPLPVETKPEPVAEPEPEPMNLFAPSAKDELLRDINPALAQTAVGRFEQLPTVTANRREVNEAVAVAVESMNDRHRQQAPDLGEKLKEAPIRDLKKAIGINDRFLFIRELFNSDEVRFDRSIKTINSFSIYPEAEYWMRRELFTKLGWNESNETVAYFVQLVKRRFS